MAKIAIVTGANKGIGFEIAKKIAETGVKTILACRTEAFGKATEELLKKEGLDVEYRQLDISDFNSIDSFAASFIAEYGSLDILVNNAAVAPMASFGTPEYRALAKTTLATNYFGTIRLTEALLPLLRQALFPRLVNVASALGHKANLNETYQDAYSNDSLTLQELNGFVNQFIIDTENNIHTHAEAFTKNTNFPADGAIYSYSKIALIAATKVLARDPANARVLINAGCPGYCDTDMSNHLGPRPASEGAKTLALLALLRDDSTITGRFYENEGDSEW